MEAGNCDIQKKWIETEFFFGQIQKRKYSVDDLENEPKENKQTNQIIHSIGTLYFKLINNLFGYELLRFYSITGHSSNHEASYEYAKL